jgi:hypothetical protein
MFEIHRALGPHAPMVVVQGARESLIFVATMSIVAVARAVACAPWPVARSEAQGPRMVIGGGTSRDTYHSFG